MEWLALPLTILAMAILVNGFPSIKIHKHYHNKKEE